MYYNTTSVRGQELKTSHHKVTTQEDKIQRFFIANDEKLFTPDEVLKHITSFQGVPLTSIRRAMTNLTGEGVLEKTTIKRQGMYGKLSYCWRLAGDQMGLL